jgi:fumarate reductase flavoprotein subunit
LVAAVKAADVSGKKVIVLEKAKKPGGSSIFAHGMGEVGDIRDSQWQKDAGFSASGPQDIKGQFFDWLVSKGGAEEYFKVATKEGERKGDIGGLGGIYMPARLKKYKDLPDPTIGPGWMGSYVVDKMMECCAKMKIPVLKETCARRFVTDSEGNVTAVLADTKDGELRVNCKACVIAAGGFGANYEKLKKRWPKEYNNEEMLHLCPPTITGDCIDMAEEIGAALDETQWDITYAIGFFYPMPTHLPYSPTISEVTDQPEIVCVNLNGERWYNEGGAAITVLMETQHLSVASQPKSVAYFIADENIIQKVGPRIIKYANDKADYEIYSYDRLREDLAYEVAIDEEGASGNHTKKADTLAELAVKMKVDPSKFVQTIERYNKFCDEGRDSDFGKDSKYLLPIRKPPYYAFYGHRFTQCTKGLNGIAVNGSFEVLNKKGEVIPGLFAGGDGCTIFGGKTIMRPKPGSPSGGGSGATAGNILLTAPSACSGLGAAFISGYYCGINAGKYLNSFQRFPEGENAKLPQR